MTNLRLAFTADLHWGVRTSGDDATRALLVFLRQTPPDVLVLAGDVGAGEDFERCLALFADLPCRKALVPGNHDIWVSENDPRGDSLQVYREHLPRLCGTHGFHYLDDGPLLFADAGLAVVGSINWYDYSWSLAEVQRQFPDWEERLRTKRFSRGRHNDARFVRWPLNDVFFTQEVVAKLERHLAEALALVPRAIVVTHHPPCSDLNAPLREETRSPDRLLWDAFSGNQALEAILLRHAERLAFVCCGHTHREREAWLGPVRGCNIGGDYHFKRLLFLDWPAGQIEAHVFGDPKDPGAGRPA